MSNQSLAQQTDVALAIDFFRQWVQAQMAIREQPGISIAVAYDQDLIWAEGFGYADVEKQIPATPQTIYRIASITKLFTSTAIVQLRDAGKLQLDDPVEKHLPWFKVQSSYEHEAPVTIRNLLTHTAGLPREANFPYWSTLEFPTKEEIMAALPDQRFCYPPYTRWKYSNLGLALAGYIVEAVSGQSYDDYIQEHILDPLGMTSTSVHLSEEHMQRLATGYSRRLPGQPRSVVPFTESAGITPAANMASTVEDLVRFAALQYRNAPADNAQQILSGSSLREMHRVQWLADNWTHGWGLGFSITRVDGRTRHGHGGSLTGYRTQLSFSLKEKITIVVMTNANDGMPDLYVEQAWKILAPAIVKATTPPPSPVSLEGLERYVGLYRSSWGDLQVALRPSGLVLFAPNALDPLSTVMTLTKVGEHTFLTDSDDGYATNAELAVFELDETGTPTRLTIGTTYSDYVGKHF
jgi:Beta-lactamase class C and other penicillin binding proteins